MTVTAYLVGPDVFLPNAVEHAARKVAICQRFGFRGLPPLNQDVETAANELKAWQAIFEKDVAMMERSDIIIANLTSFGGASADAGTLIEVGWFLGRGKPIFGYSNTRSWQERAPGRSRSFRDGQSRIPQCRQATPRHRRPRTRGPRWGIRYILQRGFVTRDRGQALPRS